MDHVGLFDGEEGTMSSFQGLSETIIRYGLFSAFYTDRGSHDFLTPEAGGRMDKKSLTQVGRALSQVGIRHIPSYSPEARGRMERAFGTLQGRLPQQARRHHYVRATVSVHHDLGASLPIFDGQPAASTTSNPVIQEAA